MEDKMKISIASDHGGFDLKEEMVKYLEEKGYDITDCGCNSKDSCDYPEFARQAATLVAEGKCDKGIVICTTGIGVSITANKVKGIRCALCHNEYTATMTRLHNDSNVIAIGAAVVETELAKKMVDIFLETEFSGEEKHQRRINKIEA